MQPGIVLDEVNRHRMWGGRTSDQDYEAIIAQGGRIAAVYGGLRRIRDAYLAEIRTRYPDIPRRVSGYDLDSLLPRTAFTSHGPWLAAKARWSRCSGRRSSSNAGRPRGPSWCSATGT